MTTYARIVSGQAVDVTTIDPVQVFHPEIAAQFVTVPDGTSDGDLFNGSAWTKRPAPAPLPVDPVKYELLTPMTFYMAFKPAERIAIRKSTDAMVGEFWSTYELSAQLGKPTDPNLASIKEGL